jgi:hypothetical protein
VRSEAISALATKLIGGVALAALLGGAGAVVSGKETDAVQNQRLSQLEQDREQMHELSNKLDETNRNVAVLNERLNHEVNK